MPSARSRRTSRQSGVERPVRHPPVEEAPEAARFVETLPVPRRVDLMLDPRLPDVQRQTIGRNLSHQVGNRAVRALVQNKSAVPLQVTIPVPAIQGGWFSNLKQKAKSALGKIKQGAQSAWSKAGSGAKSLWSKTKAGAKGLWSKAKEGAAKLFSRVKGAAQNAWAKAKGVAGKAWSTAGRVAQTVWAKVQGMGVQLWTKLKTRASTGWAKLKSLAGRTWARAKGLAQRAWTLAKSKVSQGWNAAKGIASRVWSRAKELGGAVGSRLLGLARGAVSTVKEAAVNLWNRAKQTALQGWSSAKNVAGRMWAKAKTLAKDTWKAIKKRFERPKTGLGREEAVERFTGRAKQVFEKWTTITKAERMKRLGEHINAELKNAGSFPCAVDYVSLPGATNGEFDFRTWKLKINKKLMEVANPTAEQVGKLTDTVYHEARHSEQWFRIARLRAGEGRTSKQIADQMFIPAKVAKDAADKPLKPLSVWTRVLRSRQYNERNDQSLQEAKAWYDSIYGKGAKHRNQVLGDIQNRYNEYRALSEEADAWKVGGAVSSKFKELTR